jgi:putative nucleotidyltransferase with HDIG domain
LIILKGGFMTREVALDILKAHLKSEHMIKHSLASEAVLRSLAKFRGENEELWGLAGLLHDIDYELTNGDPKTHGLEAKGILKEYSIDPAVIEAIELHNECATETPRTKPLHYALAAGETITGLITAVALVYPDKKLASVKTKSVTKRMKDKGFAASVSREAIMECEKLGLSLDEFAQLSLSAMQGISEDLGL